MRAAAFAALILGFASPAHAERYILDYRGEAFGVAPLGAATLDAEIGDAEYRAASTLRSGGLLALFERTTLSALAEGSLISGEVRAGRYDLNHFYSRKHRTITLQWSNGGVQSAIAPTYRLWGDPPATEAQRNAARDPLSTLLAMGVDVARTRRCAGAYPTFDGRFYYRMTLSGGRTTEFDSGGFDGRAVRCTLRYEPVSGFESDDGGRRMHVRRGEIWFGLVSDAFAPPVRITVPLPVGSASIELVRWRRASVDVQAQ